MTDIHSNTPSRPTSPTPRKAASEEEDHNDDGHNNLMDGPRPKKQKTSGGFKWKDKSSTYSNNTNSTSALDRGYRDRSPRRDPASSYQYRDRSPRRGNDRDTGDSYRARSPRRDFDRQRRGGGGGGGGDRWERASGGNTSNGNRADRDQYRNRDRGDTYRPNQFRNHNNNERREDAADDSQHQRRQQQQHRDDTSTKQRSKKPKEDKEKKKQASTAPGSGEPMIIVYVNDRLGTKAEIPCLASDSVKAFKALVAMRIGRAPHEILLKRQGERPFKDILTLADYGVSHGVQLDLELDTGD